MELHRPLDLNKINEDFFSGNIQNDIDAEEKAPDTAPVNDLKTDEIVDGVFSSIDMNKGGKISDNFSLEEIKSLLSALDVIQESGIFHDLPEKTDSEEKIDDSLPANESLSDDAFPEIDLENSVFNLTNEPSGKKAQKKKAKEKLKIEKESAEKKIDEEKKRLKEQKALEHNVQKPFRKRRICVILLVFLLLADMLVFAFSFLVSKVGTDVIAPMKLFGYNISFVQEGIIKNDDEYINSIIFFKNTTVQGNQTILFLSDSSAATIGEVIAIGENIYAVDLKTSVIKVGSDRIVGVINFAIPNTGNILTLIRTYANYLLIAYIVFAVVILLVFILRIVFLNKKIKVIKESYELI